MQTKKRKYPIGIQIFENLIKEGMVYVDKTDLVWQLTQGPKYTFLSRPRRFGKTLLVSTLQSYFEGERALFEGLKIMDYEQEWKHYPVVHLDLSTAKGKPTPDDLRRYLNLYLDDLYPQYTQGAERLPGEKLGAIIKGCSREHGLGVVVLIDEYDAPLLEVMHEQENMDQYKEVMKEFFGPLKACERWIRFCFITGITKFSQLSIFSTLNNIMNVSMQPEYAALCGVSEAELTTVLREDVEELARRMGCSADEAHEKLKRQYDGYHFSDQSDDIYNPYSLFNCFYEGRIKNYWFESGTPTMLINQIKQSDEDITKWESTDVRASAFDRPTEVGRSLVPLLYQSGYLTIQSYDPDTELYHLGIPNQEVRIGMSEDLLSAFSGIEPEDVQDSFGARFYRALKQDNIDAALNELKVFLAGVPYINGFKKKLADVAVKEAFYQYSLYLIFNTLNAFTRTEVAIHTGRIDMVVEMPLTTYVFEFKVGQSAAVAMRQIEEKRYAEAYQTEGRRVVKVGVQFDLETWTILGWETKLPETMQ